MTLKLNDPEDLTLDRVKMFVAACDDSVHRQLRVTQGGVAFRSDTVGGGNIEGIAFRLETWARGNDYTGKKASLDEKWVGRIYEILRINWPKPSSSPLPW